MRNIAEPGESGSAPEWCDFVTELVADRSFLAMDRLDLIETGEARASAERSLGADSLIAEVCLDRSLPYLPKQWDIPDPTEH